MSVHRQIGFWGAFALVVNVQLGSAMFMLPRMLSGYGWWGIISWGVTGIGALALCHVFSVLSRLHSAAGGPHMYLLHAWGKRAGFYVAWTYWIVSWISSLPLLVLGVDSIAHLMGASFSSVQTVLIQLSVLVCFMLLNIRGAQFSGAGEIIFSVLKVLPLVIIPFVAWQYSQPHLIPPFSWSRVQDIYTCGLITFWGFVGLEAGTTIADCVRNPERTIPRALCWGTLLVVVLYGVNTWSILRTVPANLIAGETNACSVLLGYVWGPEFSYLAHWITALLCFGSLNSWLLASGQVAYTAAANGLFPSLFHQSNRFNAPIRGVQVTTACLAGCVLLLQSQSLSHQIDSLINLSVSFFIAIYLAVIAVLVFYIMKRKVKSSILLWSSLMISSLFCVWVVCTTSWHALWILGLIPLSGHVAARWGNWPIK
jgi:APA family basic amino acid/polyamine antiporter